MKSFEGATIPFAILDVREAHERQIKDLVRSVFIDEQEFTLPRVDLLYEELVTGCFNKDYFSRDVWVVCLC